MPEIALIIGAAGVGKTTRLLQTMERAMDAGGLDPREIGFVSFTRAARREAAERAASRFDLKPSDLEQYGWFRTIHSICYKQLAVGDELLSPGKESQAWLREYIQEDVSGPGDGVGGEDGDFVESLSRTPADVALGLWGVARARLVPFETVHERASRCDERTPDLDFCQRVVERYESAKRLDHRCDFTDLLGRYSGKQFHFKGHLEVDPFGEVPDVPVWIFDESQDNSALVDAVARRLTANARWVYLAGDPFQAIYGFAGSDPSLFQSWDVKPANRHVLAQSYRCPADIVDLGESIVRDCQDYWDRGVQPAGHEGVIDVQPYTGDWPSLIDPSESWLLMARTNFQARRLESRLNANSIPNFPARGRGGWARPSLNRALTGLLGLSRGEACFADEWKHVCKAIPSKANGRELLARGTKAEWESRKIDDHEEHRLIDNLAEWGATEHLTAMLRDGRWTELIDQACQFRTAVDRYGLRYTLDPQVRVGSVHSAKGLEADNVILFTTASHQVWNSRQDPDGADEERRIGYVAVTRTKQRLIILREGVRFQMEIPV